VAGLCPTFVLLIFTSFLVIIVRAMETQAPVDYREIITIEPGKRSGKPCIRGLRITVYDVLGWLAAGMSEAEILDDFPDLTIRDIRAVLAFAADRDSYIKVVQLAA
jgi:uncharacterized protein (DUF433 family)